MRCHRGRYRGFTLIELLVVIAIIAVLAAILFPVFARAKGAGLQTRCSSNLKQLTMAWQRYVDDYNGRTAPYCNDSMPDPPYWAVLLPWKGTTWVTGLLSPYLKSATIAECPAYQKRTNPNDQNDYYFGTYGYNGFYLVWAGTNKEWTLTNAGTSVVTMSMIQSLSKTICLIDSLDGWATSPKSPQAWPNWGQTAKAKRHSDGWNVSYSDGHVSWQGAKSNIAKNDYLWALNKGLYRR